MIELPLPPGCLPTLWNNDEGFVSSYLTDFPGFYKTADAGFEDEDGYFWIMTRTDDVINVAGHRLSTGEMEEVLASHPDVAECAVVGVHDALKGQVPFGFLVLKSGVTRDADDVIGEVVTMVRERIGPVAAFKQATIVERLPKTRSGKILRGTIRPIADGAALLGPGNHRRSGDSRRDQVGASTLRLCGWIPRVMRSRPSGAVVSPSLKVRAARSAIESFLMFSPVRRLLLRDQCVVERGDTPGVLALCQHHRKQRTVFSGERTRGRFQDGFHVGQENPRRDRTHSGHLIADDAALVNRVEDALMSPGDGFTGPNMLTADVDEVSILGKMLRERRAIPCVPRLLEVGNQVRHDPFAIYIHPVSLILSLTRQ